MAEKQKFKNIKHIVIFAIASLAAGCVNGLLGTGGGIILAYLFAYAGTGNAKDNLASAMAVILPVSVVSLFTYDGGYFPDKLHFFVTALPAALGGTVGAYIGDKVSADLLNKIFSALVIYAGINMIF